MHPVVAGLLRIVRKIAKWILDVAARRGGKWLGEYICERVGVFRARLARALKGTSERAQRRALWLKGRISRWLAASKWLQANAGKLDDKAIGIVRELARKLPATSPLEREPLRETLAEYFRRMDGDPLA